MTFSKIYLELKARLIKSSVIILSKIKLIEMPIGITNYIIMFLLFKNLSSIFVLVGGTKETFCPSILELRCKKLVSSFSVTLSLTYMYIFEKNCTYRKVDSLPSQTLDINWFCKINSKVLYSWTKMCLGSSLNMFWVMDQKGHWNVC